MHAVPLSVTGEGLTFPCIVHRAPLHSCIAFTDAIVAIHDDDDDGDNFAVEVVIFNYGLNSHLATAMSFRLYDDGAAQWSGITATPCAPRHLDILVSILLGVFGVFGVRVTLIALQAQRLARWRAIC